MWLAEHENKHEFIKFPTYSVVFLILIEGLKIELELSASEANISILSHDSQQPIIAKPPAGGCCSDSCNNTCMQVELFGRSV